MKLVVRGGRLVDPSQDLDGVRDLLIEDGKVAEVAETIEVGEDCEVLDASGLVVTPGLVDIHVHLREPGQEYKEDVRSGTRAAAAGGFTAVVSMPNTVPVNDDASVTGLILREAEKAGFARVYPSGAITKGMKGEELSEMGELRRAGCVCVSDDGLPVAHPELMRRALLYAQHWDLPVVQHAEDLRLTGKGVMHEGEWSARLGLAGIPGAAEDVLVARDLLLLEETGGRYHVQHVSSGRTVELIRDAKARGLPVTAEVSPHHLLLTDEAVATSEFSTDVKMKPPLRSARDREMLLEGLLDGTLDCIASDHAPHHPDEKDVEFDNAPFGILGLETTVPILLEKFVHGGVMELSRFVELLSTAPCRVMGIPGGSLKVGEPGDVTLLDLDAEHVIDKHAFQSKSRNTPFHGWEGRGKAVGTVVGGRRVELD
jgi:dihydroorotase